MSKIEDIVGTEFTELLQQVHLGKLDVVDSHTSERLDMSEKLLGVVSAPADDTITMLGMAWEVSGSVLHFVDAPTYMYDRLN